MDFAETSPLLSSSQSRSSLTENGQRSVWRDGCRFWPKVYTTEVAMFLYGVYVAATRPLTDQFVYTRIAREMNYTREAAVNCGIADDSSPESRLRDQVQKESATIMLVQISVQMLPIVFLTLVLGNLSDRAGRKFVMICPCVGAVIHCFLCALVVWLELPLLWIYVGSAIEGCLGGHMLFSMAAYAHLSDLTTTSQRSFRIILIECCLGLGKAVSQLALGYTIKWCGYAWPYIILMAFVLLDIIYIVLCVPETVPPQRGVKLFSRKHLLGTFNLYLKDDGNGRRWKLWITMAIILLLIMPRSGSSDVVTYHLLDSPLCWDSVLIGQFGSYRYFLQRFGGLLGVVLFGRCLKDIGLVILGVISGICYYVIFALAPSTTVVFLAPLLGIFGDMADKILRSMNSKIVGSNELGAMYGSLAWADAFALLSSGVAFNAIYKATLVWMSTFVFWLMAGIDLLALLITVIYFIKMKMETNVEHEAVTDDVHRPPNDTKDM